MLNAVFIYSLASAVGQNFVYYTVTEFGPLLLTTVTTPHFLPPPLTPRHPTSPRLASPRLASPLSTPPHRTPLASPRR